MNRMIFLTLLLFTASSGAQEKPAEDKPRMRRVANIYVAESFINEQIKIHAGKSEIFKDLRLDLDAKKDHLYLTGLLLLPLEELQTMGLDRSMGQFRFQVAIKPRAGKNGQLRLEFPIAETYLYLAKSKKPVRDRVVVPVQLLSLALGSARGYLAALSGNFSAYDRKTEKVKAELRAVRRKLAEEKLADNIISLELKEKALRLQLEMINIERAQIAITSKSLTNILSFAGQKELNLNDEIVAEDNAINFNLRLAKLVPYLRDIELASVRVSHDPRDGDDGEDYFVVGVDSALETQPPAPERRQRRQREPLKVPPALLMRINQAVFNSKTVVEAQRKTIGAHISDLDVSLKDDGIHVTGKVKKFFLTIPFDTTVDLVTTAPDVFEVRLRKLNIRGFDFKFLTSYVLDAIKERLDNTLVGICKFEYLGEGDDESQVLQVTVEPKNLVPAFPNLHLVEVDVGNREFLLKIGHVEGGPNESR